MVASSWPQTSYIVFVAVHLYLGLLENVLPCNFHMYTSIRDFYKLLDAVFLFYRIVSLKFLIFMIYGYMIAKQSCSFLGIIVVMHACIFGGLSLLCVYSMYGMLFVPKLTTIA